MKEKTADERGSAERKSASRSETEKQLPGPETTMHTEFQTRKARGRLTREDQRRLGDVLQRVYDDVLKQGVPDRFKNLIDQLGHHDPPAEAEEGATSDLRRERNSETAHSVQAKGGDKSKDDSA